jgi:ubiquitin-protein ligase
MDNIQKIIDDIYRAHDYKKRIQFDENLKLLILESMIISPYVTNVFKYALIQNDKNDTIIKPVTENFNDYLINKHVLSVILNNEKTIKRHYKELTEHDTITITNENMTKFFTSVINNFSKNENKYYKYCPICFKEKDLNMMIIEPCINCLPISYSIICDNTITEAFNKDQTVFKLLLCTSLEAVKVKERFFPVPPYCANGQYDYEQLNISTEFDYYIKKIMSCSMDKDIFNSITKKEYMFLKHIIKSNNTKLNYYDNTNSPVRIDNVWDTQKPILFTIDHPIDKQNKFDQDKNVVYMFHGSPIHNWYSIMRNGLKNYSGTNMMSCGQAYGPGIYLASHIDFAYGYCYNRGNNGNNQYYIIGVVQVLNSSKYKKTEQIYVVPDESDVLLKYLVFFKSKNNFTDIEKYLTVDLPSIVKTCSVEGIKIILKRINKEYSELSSKIEKIKRIHGDTKININTNINNIKNIDDIKWSIGVSFGNDKNLTITVRFPQNFPSAPPTILFDGCVNIPMLSNEEDDNSYKYVDPIMNYDRWRSNVKVYKIMEHIVINLLNAQ